MANSSDTSQGRETADSELLEYANQRLRDELDRLMEEDPEISDYHSAFEAYCLSKYSLGNTATDMRTAGKDDLGIDFYSHRERRYVVAQCKVPTADWIEANPRKPRVMGSQAVDDVRDALSYLLRGECKRQPNDRVQELYARMELDRSADDFHITHYVLVWGRLNARALGQYEQLAADVHASTPHVRLRLHQVDDLVQDFMVGAAGGSDVTMRLRTATDDVFTAKSHFHYFLANAADVHRAFRDYGWRLFDLNLRYEVQNSPINGDIIESLAHHRSRRTFFMLNNGLIVVGSSIKKGKNGAGAPQVVTITDAQVVNGLQTVVSLHRAVANRDVSVSELEQDCAIAVKVITSRDAEQVSKIVQATNNQNPMSKRNLRANSIEQKELQARFRALSHRWFYERKEGEWRSLTQENAPFFKQIVGAKPSDFRTPKGTRVIDSEFAAKAWLAFCGFADLAGDRVTHYFANDDVYALAFRKRPKAAHWTVFAGTTDFALNRESTMELAQGGAEQYLLAYFIWQFAKSFVPASAKLKEEALDRGHKAGRITKVAGSFTSSPSTIDEYLASDDTYQTWRLMSNMKESLVEFTAYQLAKVYGPLTSEVAARVLRLPEAEAFVETASVKAASETAREGKDLPRDAVFGRTFGFLRYVAAQFWQDKGKSLLSTSRLRTVLLSRDVAREFKQTMQEVDSRTTLDRTWKPEGTTFSASLPPLPA